VDRGGRQLCPPGTRAASLTCLRETIVGSRGASSPGRLSAHHRSAIVNLDAVRELEPGTHGDFVVVLKSGKRLPLSRGCRDRLEEALGTT